MTNLSLMIRLFSILCLMAVCDTADSEPLWVFFNETFQRTPGDPVSNDLIKKVESTGASIRVVSRYFNAVSVEWDGGREVLEAVSGVSDVRPVRSMKGIPPGPENKSIEKKSHAYHGASHVLDYGDSYDQLAILNVPALHDIGYTGQGVCIGVLDSGFNFEGTGCLEGITVAHTKNFVRGGEDVRGDNHGGYVLSCLGGAREGEYYGVAYGASYLLAMTDDPFSEHRADEDRWVAAVEWCDSLGADIISSSLVYNIFNTLEESYSKDDMDGRTSLVALAAEIAVSRGIVVVNAAGNEGNNSWGIITTPGDSEHVIAVGAVTYTEGKPVAADFSSRGPTADGRIKPDVVAPGVDVLVPQLGLDGYYLSRDGTSFATPFVSGICALLLEAHPDWTPSDVMEALKLTASDLGEQGPDNHYGWGLPDASKAVSYLPAGVEDYLFADDSFNVQHRSGTAPREIFLGSPFPNPFNNVVTIPFTSYKGMHLTISIRDILGRRIATVWDKHVYPGKYQAVWSGEGSSSGIYFVRVIDADNIACKKIMLIK